MRRNCNSYSNRPSHEYLYYWNYMRKCNATNGRFWCNKRSIEWIRHGNCNVDELRELIESLRLFRFRAICSISTDSIFASKFYCQPIKALNVLWKRNEPFSKFGRYEQLAKNPAKHCVFCVYQLCTAELESIQNFDETIFRSCINYSAQSSWHLRTERRPQYQ